LRRKPEPILLSTDAATAKMDPGFRRDDGGRLPTRSKIADAKLRYAMPIYEFECPDCGEIFERLQKLSDPDPTTCPACGKTHVKRKLTAPAFRLAGSGWYETDFKKDGDRKRNLAAKDDAPKTDSKSAAGGESAKPAPSGTGGGTEAKPAAARGKTKDAKDA
jgi:putative FmdB family regulatory protein